MIDDDSLDNEYSGTPPYDHPVYKTTSLLRPYSFKPNVKTIESFYYFEDPVNATTSLLRPGFYGPTVVALTGFHCICDLFLKFPEVFVPSNHYITFEYDLGGCNRLSCFPRLLENYYVIVAGKTRHVIWELNFVQESRNCVVVRSRGAYRVGRFECRSSKFYENWCRWIL